MLRFDYIVVVGANGSGKTRFGIWLLEHNHGRMSVLRISAQKALAIPEFAAVKNVEQVEKELYFGRSDRHASAARKVHDRWGGSPATYLLSDYEKLLALLFAKDAERDRNHTVLTSDGAIRSSAGFTAFFKRVLLYHVEWRVSVHRLNLAMTTVQSSNHVHRVKSSRASTRFG
jgi:hypothetical protein